MKTKLILLAIASIVCSFSGSAQTSWQINGNSNISNNNFIGTTNKTALKLRTNNIIRMTINSSGNIGIGTAGPKSRLDVAGTVLGYDSYFGKTYPISAGTSGASYSSVGYGLTFTDTTANYRYRLNDFSSMLSFINGGFDFNTAPFGTAGSIIPYTTVMTILQNGNVGIGTSSPGYKLHVKSAPPFTFPVAVIENTSDSWESYGLGIKAGSNTEVGAILLDLKRPDGSRIGFVQQNNTTSVAYATTSDKRLKNIIGTTQKGLADLMKIKIYDYTFKSDPQKQVLTGLMAQELYNIFPQSVSKPRDNNETAEKDPWMVDYGSVTPLIIKSVQEQQQIIEEQKAEITTLKERLTKLETALANVIAMKDEPSLANASATSSVKK